MPKILWFNGMLCLVMVASFVSCMSTKKFIANANLDTSIVPQGYNPKQHILLVAEMPRLSNRKEANKVVTSKLKNCLEKIFPYKYEIVSLEEIRSNSSKYNDTMIYKYALLSTITSSEHMSSGSSHAGANGTWVNTPPRMITSTSIDFHFYDRVSKTDYPNTGNGASYLKYPVAALSAIVKKAKQ